jgi:hypothetical protein
MEGQFKFTFKPLAEGESNALSAASMVMEAPTQYTLNHVYAIFILLRDAYIESSQRDAEFLEHSNELYVDDMNELIELFNRHPKEPVFKRWSKSIRK